jgi:hypothetical protein
VSSRTSNGNNKKSVVPRTTSPNGGLENTLKRRNENSPRLNARSRHTILAFHRSVSSFHSQDEDTTLRDFLLKSTAKVQTFPDMDKKTYYCYFELQ